MVKIDVKTYKALYLKTSREYLTDLKKNLDFLNQNLTHAESIYEVFRLAHSIKSQNYVMNYMTTGDICKVIEDFFRPIKDNEKAYDPKYFQTILMAINCVVKSIDNIEKNNTELDLTNRIIELKKNLNIY